MLCEPYPATLLSLTRLFETSMFNNENTTQRKKEANRTSRPSDTVISPRPKPLFQSFVERFSKRPLQAVFTPVATTTTTTSTTASTESVTRLFDTSMFNNKNAAQRKKEANRTSSPSAAVTTPRPKPLFQSFDKIFSKIPSQGVFTTVATTTATTTTTSKTTAAAATTESGSSQSLMENLVELFASNPFQGLLSTTVRPPPPTTSMSTSSPKVGEGQFHSTPQPELQLREDFLPQVVRSLK